MCKSGLKTILFGAGGYLSNCKWQMFKDLQLDIIGIADNNSSLWGSFYNGIRVDNLSTFTKTEYDIIVLTSTYAFEIETQLIEEGIDRNIIKRIPELIAYTNKAKIEHIERIRKATKGKEILFISRNLDFTGSSIAALYAMLALETRGYRCAIASKSADKCYLDYIKEFGMEIWIYPNIEFEKQENMKWIDRYDYVVINTYHMQRCLANIQHNRMSLWLHDPVFVFENNIKFWGKIDKEIEQSDCRIYAVSKAAKENFHRFYPQISVQILEYGIPKNINIKGKKDSRINDRIIFALVGIVYQLKGQDVLLDAIRKLSAEERRKSEFWIIGKISNNKYGQMINRNAKEIENVKILGEMTHDEMDSLYNNIDVLISASREDMLPIVIVEAMMRKIPCIISDAVGLMDYIDPVRDALVFKSEDPDMLAEVIKTVIHSKDDACKYADHAYQVYEKYFSMESYADRLELMLEDMSGY